MSFTVEQAREEATAARERGEEFAREIAKEFNLNLSPSNQKWFERQIGVAFINEYSGFWRHK